MHLRFRGEDPFVPHPPAIRGAVASGQVGGSEECCSATWIAASGEMLLHLVTHMRELFGHPGIKRVWGAMVQPEPGG